MMMLALALAGTQASNRPAAFIERIYSSYRQAGFNPLDHPGRYFAPRLLAAISEDARLSKGEVGYLDGDPICQCQDPAGLDASVTKVRMKGPQSAAITVSIRFAGEKPRRATFRLARTKAGWRIADISSPEEPSLLSAIERSNRTVQGKR